MFAQAKAEDRSVLVGCMPAGFPTVEHSIASMARNVSRVRTPPRSAMSLAFWITGPSITGSE